MSQITPQKTPPTFKGFLGQLILQKDFVRVQLYLAITLPFFYNDLAKALI